MQFPPGPLQSIQNHRRRGPDVRRAPLSAMRFPPAPSRRQTSADSPRPPCAPSPPVLCAAPGAAPSSAAPGSRHWRGAVPSAPGALHELPGFDRFVVRAGDDNDWARSPSGLQ